MKYEISKPLAIHQLGKRENQEDAIFPALDEATAEDRLFILCDGMGGHAKGEVASQTVCQELSEFIMKETDRSAPFTDNMLDAAMKRMYQVLNEKSQTIGDSKMGTTMVFLYFHPGGVMAAHIGDSRYYHIRPKTHSIVYRSKDHSLVNQLLEVGQITQEEGGNDERQERDFARHYAKPGDTSETGYHTHQRHQTGRLVLYVL